MEPRERAAWVQVVVAPAGWAVYVVLLLVRAGDEVLVETGYWDLVAWAIGGAVVVSLLATLAVGGFDGAKPDLRDREIDGRAQQIGNSLLVAGALVAMVLAMVDVDGFWIANTLYLTFVSSGLLASIAQIGFRRGGVPGW
ncbi:hypothetical protein L1785_19275 [Antribacter sp. KLBMP9083]|uniref:Uncharacterized protein n=1 Tax=Antribacter soli TaxID=2910976 RepID=A0AA41QJ09_9MICO|nr:hypothetical protein [Antribacter soli]MCF4123117.1 hypothetical protein [Antribacter soli]